MSADKPRPGDWFVVPNHITGVRAPERDGTHPYIVNSAWPHPQVKLLLRSASSNWGAPHKAHLGSCGSESCRVNRDGRIDDSIVHSVDRQELTDYSCREPDDEVIEWVMGIDPDHGGKRGRR